MSCPRGMKPSADYVTCERDSVNDYTGKWKFPKGVREHEIVCLESNAENPYEKPVCKDLSKKYFDETVDVSFPNKLC